MVAMKALMCLSVFVVLAAATRFEKEDVVEVRKLFGTIRQEITEERQRDQEVVNQSQRELADATKNRDTAELAWKRALKEYQVSLTYFTSNTAHLNKLNEEYTAAKKTRTAEEDLIAKIHSEFQSMASIGGSAKAVGELDPVADYPTEDLSIDVAAIPESSSNKEKLQSILLQLARGDVSLPVMKSNLDTVAARVATEDSEDMSRVTAQKAVVAEARTFMDNKQAVERGKKAYYDQTIVEFGVATQKLAFCKAEFVKSDATRKQDEESISAMEAKFVEMINVRGEPTLDLQEERTSAATLKLKETLQVMWDDVQDEEDNQIKLVAFKKKLMDDAAALMRKKEAEFIDAKSFTATKLAAFESAKVALFSQQRALTTERTTAAKERAVVSTLRQTIERFRKLKLVTGGKCPIVDGSYCSGAGDCVEDACKCNRGHVGASCAVCAMNYVMKNGVCIMSEELLEVNSVGPYSRDDINTMLVQLGREASETNGIDALLGELITKLDVTEKSMTDARDKRQTEYNTASKEYLDARAAQKVALENFQIATKSYETKRAEYTFVQALYDSEMPLRKKEQTLLKDVIALIDRMALASTYKMETFSRPPAASTFAPTAK